MMLYEENIITKEENISGAVATAWSAIAPFWPLKNLIAVNPLAGLEEMSFEQALKKGQAYFQQKEIPASMLEVNRQSIKWLQAFFDEGQATIQMPLRHKGFLKAILELLPYDGTIVIDADKASLINPSQDSREIITACLHLLRIPARQHATFLTLLLTTLPGWAAHIRYRTNWADAADRANVKRVSQEEYLAFRILLTCLIWPGAKALLSWHEQAIKNTLVKPVLEKIEATEQRYRNALLHQLPLQYQQLAGLPDAQLVFCIDVRSEPFRRALEAQGNYETLGFAGFFGVPVAIRNNITGDQYASCPVLLQPAHEVAECASCNHEDVAKKYERKRVIKRLYQSLKYTFTAPFALVETLGPLRGITMALRNIMPGMYVQAGEKAGSPSDFQPVPDAIPFRQQCAYAENALRTMGLTKDFAPMVVFCGHGSETQNNAYATALDCGACGGHHGAPNARILAKILNTPPVREVLASNGISIPQGTWFLAAEHNTTTDMVVVFQEDLPAQHRDRVDSLKADLEKARHQNSYWRTTKMDVAANMETAAKHTAGRARDWAQIRPEWGLARNAAFIVGPRALTKNLDLDGRCFLHSYDWQQDADGKALTVILTAPMVVGQWINSQYLFSTIDNVAFGGGSKISKNITGKIAIMQGNASDLMCGLPLQSVYATDADAYHEPVRLTTVVYAPQQMITGIIAQQEILQKLFGNGWVTLVCIDPVSKEKLLLDRDLNWQAYQ